MRNYIIATVIVILFSACVKEENKHPVPDIQVYLQYPISINDIEFIHLRDIYGAVILDGEGYMGNGILVVNTGIIDNNNNPYKAYDATCPNEVEKGCAIDFDDSSISLVGCSCCDSQFEISYGSVNEGPAKYPLKTYKTVFDGEYIRVYN